MGDRFYTQQAAYKPKRVFKKDILEELASVFQVEPETLVGFAKLTIKDLNFLVEQVTKNVDN